MWTDGLRATARVTIKVYTSISLFIYKYVRYRIIFDKRAGRRSTGGKKKGDGTLIRGRFGIDCKNN